MAGEWLLIAVVLAGDKPTKWFQIDMQSEAHCQIAARALEKTFSRPTTTKEAPLKTLATCIAVRGGGKASNPGDDGDGSQDPSTPEAAKPR